MVIGVHNSDKGNIDALAATSDSSNPTLDETGASQSSISAPTSATSSSIIYKNSVRGYLTGSDGKSSSAVVRADINIDESAKKAIEYWKSENKGVKLTSTFERIAMEAYKIHFLIHRGLTREDLVNKLKYKKGSAKNILYECQNIKLLIPLEGHKQGRFNEYFLSTEINKFLERQQQKKEKSKWLANDDELSVIQILINEVTQRKPTFHKVFIHFNTISFEKDATFDNVIYQSLTPKDNWIEKSKENKAKVKSFKLEHKRSCTIQVYPNCKVVISIECSYRPFKLHEEEGSQDFWKSIGKIELLLGQEFGQTLILPPSGQWLLKGYDRDVTIPESYLKEKYPFITQWYSKEGIQLRALGRVFQIYGKIMPICGKCLRFEDKVGIKEDVPLEQGIKEAVERPLGIVSAFEMLNREKREKKENASNNLVH